MELEMVMDAMTDDLPAGFDSAKMFGPPHVLGDLPQTDAQEITRTCAFVVDDATSSTKSARFVIRPGDWSTRTDAQISAALANIPTPDWGRHVHGPRWNVAPKTPYDIDLSTGGSHAGNGVFVVVWITDENAWFMDNELAITAGDLDSRNELYGLKFHDFDPANPGSDPRPRIASFKAQSRSIPRYFNFNLGLILQQADGLRLPTFYDPKIKNDG